MYKYSWGFQIKAKQSALREHELKYTHEYG